MNVTNLPRSGEVVYHDDDYDYDHLSISAILNDLERPRFQGHGVTIEALDVLCAQLTRNLFAIADFLHHLR